MSSSNLLFMYSRCKGRGTATSERPTGQRAGMRRGRKLWLRDGRSEKKKKREEKMNPSVDPAEEKKGSGPGAPHRPGSKGIPI